jgi:hypothetical protein
MRTVASSETAAGNLRFTYRGRGSVDLSSAIALGDGTCGGQRWSDLTAVRAQFGSPRTRFWVAFSASNAGAPDTAVRQPGLAAGFERRLGRAVVGMSVGPRRDRAGTHGAIQLTQHLFPENIFSPQGAIVSQETTYVADTVVRPGGGRVPDLALAVSWTHRALAVDAGAHLALGTDVQRTDPLARLQVSYAMAPRVIAVAGVVSRGAVQSLDIPAGLVATFGLRVGGGRMFERRAPNGSSRAAAAEFRAERVDAETVVLAVRAAAAQRVQIAGDFTHWETRELEPAPDGWWRIRVHAAAGAHQLSVRVDSGRWTAPPGLPPVRDEFGATVGLLIVQ